jgi:FkbM family methyltransferase
MGTERQQRSLFENYREQIAALGGWRWLVFKVRKLQSRFVPAGRPISVSTPLALHPVAFRAGTSDGNVFSQIFLHREYRCLDDVARADLVIDGGANVGYSSAYFLSRYPEARLIAIEPDPDNFAMLARNLAPYGDRCTLIQGALWSSSSGVVISPPPPGQRREWAVTVRSAEADETATIPTVDVASLLRDAAVDRISILKVDIEGSEREVFAPDSNARTWLERVDNLVIELHGPQCRQIFMDAIDGFGFDVSTCEELTVCRRLDREPALDR